jgi:hypothetical protein
MAGPGVGERDGCVWLLRSRGRAMLVRPLMLSSPVERSTASDDGAGLWRLWRRCGRVSSGYSSRSPAALGSSMGRLGRCCGGCATARVRGDELTGFQRREAGGRGGPAYRLRSGLKLKTRFVSDQRAGSGDAAGGTDAEEDGREGAVVRAEIVAVVVRR